MKIILWESVPFRKLGHIYIVKHLLFTDYNSARILTVCDDLELKEEENLVNVGTSFPSIHVGSSCICGCIKDVMTGPV